MTKDKKRKLLAQRHVSSRMNFLFQASHLMAASHQAKLAAYYGKLCRNVGTKAVMHMAPALKRSLCRRCSLPLMPGVNTELRVAEENPTPQAGEETRTASNGEETPTASNGGEVEKTKKKRHRRLPKNRKKKVEKKEEPPANPNESQPEIPLNALFLECSLCQGRRSFTLDNQRECWLEQPQSLVQVLSLPGENAGQ
ncbi:uncharacterized protein Rpp21 [Drosophila kikkawai]|uniref:Uncharacterized protein Rpp21 n=1 Tax=Drosophila kikkawai TaxID=30033 RepID=A0ABM3C4Q3_DROKI|nr:uncharacterized protein LOC108080147 [Drosophila kikkawai]